MWLSNSSVGRKVVMSVTGIALVLFLTFHMAMNLVALVSANGYNMVCEFLGANWYALVATVGLAALFIIHIIYAFWLTMQNRKARGSERYAVTEKPKTVEWASQNMLVLGIIVIVGLGLHLVNFWAKMQLPELMHNMGMHADTLTLAYAANGVYHIQNTSIRFRVHTALWRRAATSKAGMKTRCITCRKHWGTSIGITRNITIVRIPWTGYVRMFPWLPLPLNWNGLMTMV